MSKRIPFSRILNIAVSVLFLVLFFKNVNLRELATEIAGLRVQWLPLVLIVFVIEFTVRAARWQYLLTGLRKVPLTSLLKAVVIGLMANYLLPAKMGEIVRVYVLKRKERTSLAFLSATIVIERLVEVIFTLAVFSLLFFYPIVTGRTIVSGRTTAVTVDPVIFQQIITTVGGMCVAAVVGIVFVGRNRGIALRFVDTICRPFPKRFADRLKKTVSNLLDGFGAIGYGKHWLPVLMLTAAIFVLYIGAIQLYCLSFGFHLGVMASLFLYLFIFVSSFIPSTPGAIGTYHYACALGLELLGVPVTIAKSFAIVSWGVTFITVVVAGVGLLSTENITFSALRKMPSEQDIP